MESVFLEMNIQDLVRFHGTSAAPEAVLHACNKVNGKLLAERLKQLPYRDFLQTTYWWGVSQMAKRRAKMRCQLCNGGGTLNAHHRNYEIRGEEWKNPVEITVLCAHCHTYFHGKTKVVPTISNAPVLNEKTITKEFKKDSHECFSKMVEVDCNALMPIGDPIMLTKETIDNLRTRGAFVSGVCALLCPEGLKVAGAGWVKRLYGNKVSRKSYEEALRSKILFEKMNPISKKASALIAANRLKGVI